MSNGLPAQRLDTARGLAPTQRSLDVNARILRGLPFTAGRVVELGPQVAGTFNVRHNLGRVPLGVMVIDHVRASGSTGAASVYRRTGDAADLDDLTMYTSATLAALKVWVW